MNNIALIMYLSVCAMISQVSGPYFTVWLTQFKSWCEMKYFHYI